MKLNAQLFAQAVSLVIISLPTAKADGILVYKNQSFHSNDLAHAIIYQRIEPQGVVTWATTSGQRIRFEKTQFYVWAELPSSLPNEIMSDAEKNWLTSQIAPIEKIRKDYPQTIAMTDRTFEMLDDARTNIGAGKIRHEGAWIELEAFKNAILVKENEARTKERARAETESSRLREEAANERKRKDAEAARMKVEAAYEYKRIAAETEMERAKATRIKEQQRLESLARTNEINRVLPEVESEIKELQIENNRLATKLNNLISEQ